jgi:hypothetical protein
MITISFYLLSSIFLFIREVKRDRSYYEEQDRLGDEHIMREIEKWKKENNL